MKSSIPANKYQKKTKEALRELLTQEQYRITQESATERPFQHPYHKQTQSGIYVDITTGEPLFLSSDQYDAGCGWPSFTKPIASEVVIEQADHSLFMKRVEIRSRVGDAHLGHMFNDGPKAAGGLRYCINGGALRFIKKEDMEQAGYGDLVSLLDD